MLNLECSSTEGDLRQLFFTTCFLAAFAVATMAADGPLCTFHQQFTQTYSISTTGHLKLKNDRGAVYIRGDDRTTVLIEAIKTACNQADLDVTEIHVDSHPQSTERPDHVDIETRHPSKSRDAVSVEYHITVPRNISLDRISLHNGNVEIADVNGQIHAKTDNGDVAIDGAQSACQVGSGRGSVRILFAKLAGGEHISSVRGDIHVTLPSDSSVDIEATTGLREITNDFGIPASNTSRGHALTFRIGSGHAHLEMIAFAGAISIGRAADDKPLSAVVDLSREQPARSLLD
jgi:hypothetical protein